MRRLNRKELRLISDATLKKTAELGFLHARKNVPYIKRTIRELKYRVGKPAIVISAGPSLHKRESLQIIKRANFTGRIVAVDGSLGHCLRNGIVPDFVLTVDPHPHRIVRWFGDTRLAQRPEDDYFRRQDLDPVLNRDEFKRNQELIQLVNKYGPKIKVIISTSVTPDITERCQQAGMELYWWSPLYDDYEDPNSYSRKISRITRVPCMVTGGNCGTSAWVFTHTILKSPKIILVGMDFSYSPGTRVENTQYYEILKEIFPRDPAKGLIKVYNPYLKNTWLTDPAYYWYSKSFIEMANIAPCKTYNCTEGGILFGRGVKFLPLSKALATIMKHKARKGKKG